MSKTIRKIPWAVPGLAAVALAAFLAIGLLATYGVQPVAAQDADCTVEIAADGYVSYRLRPARVHRRAQRPSNSTGPIRRAEDTDTPRVLHLFIAGPRRERADRFIRHGTAYGVARRKVARLAAMKLRATLASAIKYRYQSKSRWPKFEANPSTGLAYEAQSDHHNGDGQRSYLR